MGADRPGDTSAHVPSGEGEQDLLAPLTLRERSLLDRLLLKMERRGDFPAFARNITTVSRKADYASSYSASQLSEEILRDYGLTAKLLRVVNTSYYERLGKRVNKVSRAIVVLGFDKVRSIALGIVLHKSTGKLASAPEVAENAIEALACGEIGRRIARSAGLKDAEEAHVCAMYRDLGRHLVAHYLPDDHAKIREAVVRDGIDHEAAAEHVLGLSTRRIGIGLVRAWRLSERLAHSMVPADAAARTDSDEDRLRQVATFSHELHQLVATTPEATRDDAMGALVERWRTKIKISTRRVQETLGAVQKTLVDRLPVVHGLDPSQSAFLRHAAAFTGAWQEASRGSVLPPSARRLSIAPRHSMPPDSVVGPGSVRARPAIEDAQGAATVSKKLTELGAALEGGGDALPTLRAALKAFARAFGLRHAVVLVRTQDGASLRVQAAYGEAARSLEQELMLPLARAARPDDLVSQAYHGTRDVVVLNTFDEKVAPKIPAVYFEAIGSLSLALYRVGSPQAGVRLVLVDTDFPSRLPGLEHADLLRRFREIIGRAAAASGSREPPRVRPFVPRRL